MQPSAISMQSSAMHATTCGAGKPKRQSSCNRVQSACNHLRRGQAEEASSQALLLGARVAQEDHTPLRQARECRGRELRRLRRRRRRLLLLLLLEMLRVEGWLVQEMVWKRRLLLLLLAELLMMVVRLLLRTLLVVPMLLRLQLLVGVLVLLMLPMLLLLAVLSRRQIRRLLHVWHGAVAAKVLVRPGGGPVKGPGSFLRRPAAAVPAHRHTAAAAGRQRRHHAFLLLLWRQRRRPAAARRAAACLRGTLRRQRRHAQAWRLRTWHGRQPGVPHGVGRRKYSGGGCPSFLRRPERLIYAVTSAICTPPSSPPPAGLWLWLGATVVPCTPAGVIFP